MTVTALCSAEKKRNGAGKAGRILFSLVTFNDFMTCKAVEK